MVPRSCTDRPERIVWNPPDILPFEGLIGALRPILGKYVLIIACTVGFKSRDGMVTKRVVVLPSSSVNWIVLSAISCGVSVTLAGTTGFAESLSPEKSPV